MQHEGFVQNEQLNAGAPLVQALPMAIAFSVLVGIINGVLGGVFI